MSPAGRWHAGRHILAEGVRVIPRETVVSAGGVPIAVRDHGGTGRPLLLLHGAGGDHAAMSEFAAELARPARSSAPAGGNARGGARGGVDAPGALSPDAAAFRVVVPDLRGHGASGDGPWEWPAVLDDLEGVSEQLGLDRPVVVGWSLGGMLATMWADRHPECPAAVSLDGTPPPSRPDQCAGMDPERSRADLARLRAAYDAMTATCERPSPVTLAELGAAMEALDVIPLYRRVECRLGVVLATVDMPQQRPFHELYAAYRAGFESRLTEAARANPALRVTRVPGASHAMVAERPAELAGLVRDVVATGSRAG
jgi:pimeloyl-ACP methyl ester carboxylesterase